MSCPICENLYSHSYTCSQCSKEICNNCYQNILNAKLNKSCPFCRKAYPISSSDALTELLEDVAINYFMEEPIRTSEMGFADVIRVGYLLGTGLYFFRQIFSRSETN